MPGVDAGHGDARVAHPGGGFEECSVATDGDGEVGLRFVGQTYTLNADGKAASDAVLEIVEKTVTHYHLVVAPEKRVDKPFDVLEMCFLVAVAVDCDYHGWGR